MCVEATRRRTGRQSPAAIYFAAAQFPQSTMTVLLRASSGRSKRSPTNDLAAVATALRAAIREIDPAVPADQVRPLDDWLTEVVSPRLTTTLAAAFAAMALLLAGIGIYAVAAYSVGQRRPEIGLRIAVGATRAQIVAMILRSGLTSAGAGMAIGFTGALAVNRLLAGLLFDGTARGSARLCIGRCRPRIRRRRRPLSPREARCQRRSAGHTSLAVVAELAAVGGRRYNRPSTPGVVRDSSSMADITFGPFTIDLARHRLLRDGIELRMRPQAFQVLATLAAHGGRAVDYDQTDSSEGVGRHRRCRVTRWMSPSPRSAGSSTTADRGSCVSRRAAIAPAFRSPTR